MWRGIGSGGRGQEIRDARHQADGGLRTNGTNGGGQHPEVTSLDDLSTGHHGAVAAVHWRHVASDVGVPNNREATVDGHLARRLLRLENLLICTQQFPEIKLDFLLVGGRTFGSASLSQNQGKSKQNLALESAKFEFKLNWKIGA